MDDMVLAAQQWVNAEYEGVSGYTRCAEDGLTGWQTIYSLRRALQHELGITGLADGFGPLTLSKLEARGGVMYGDSNPNIVKIVQCGCYCKGYNPSGITGTFGPYTESAVLQMMMDAGVQSFYNNAIPPKVMKGLLSMDAYVSLSGGSDEVRKAQQALNLTFLNRPNFFLMPCDGLFSREVVKSLVIAIQYQLGYTDSQADGVFGSGTQSSLRQRSALQEGSSGNWVLLFSTALVCNGYGKATTSFTGSLAASVRGFQKFTALPETGKGDFQTFAEAIISTGDPLRRGTAADCITTITQARAETLYHDGRRYVGRYLDQRGTLDKKIKPGELETIFANGLRVFPISQYYGGNRDSFTYESGIVDATDAHNAAVGYGFPKGTVIYFAVDYDAVQVDIDEAIVPYFRGVVRGLIIKGRRYVHGVYGSRNVCREVSEKTGATYSFVSGMSTGFSGNMGFKLPANWSFNQIATLNNPPLGTGVGLIEIDNNIRKPGSDPGVGSFTPESQVAAYLAYIEEIYDLAVAYGGGDPNLLVLDFLRAENYNDSRWQFLYGAADQGFIDHVKDAGLGWRQTMVEPQQSLILGMDHVAATAYARLVGPSRTAGLDDLGGWGGDLCTFWGEWMGDMGGTASGYTYCMERLANTNVDSSFKRTDAVEDADGYLIAGMIADDATIVEAYTSQYTSGYQNRFTQFVGERLGTTAEDISESALDWLTDERPDVLMAAQQALHAAASGDLTVQGPATTPTYKRTPFFTGFGEVFEQLVEGEA